MAGIFTESILRFLEMKHTPFPDRLWKKTPFKWYALTRTYLMSAPTHPLLCSFDVEEPPIA